MNPVEPCMEPAVLISHQFNNVFDQKAIYHTKSSLYHSTISIYRTSFLYMTPIRHYIVVRTI